MNLSPLARFAFPAAFATLCASSVASFPQTPTPWWVRHSVSLQDISQDHQNGWRPISIDDAGNGRYAVVYVKNTGAYAKNWILAENKTVAELASNAYAGFRMVDAFDRKVGSATRYCALFIKNTGADQRAWYWRQNKPFNALVAEARNLGYRPLAFDKSASGFNAVFVKNTGTPDQTTWWAYPLPANGSFINTQAAKLNAIPSVLDDALIFESRRAGDRVGTFYRASLPWIDRESKRLGLRVHSFTKNASGTFSGIFVTNINAPTAGFVDQMASQTDGMTGVFLRRIGTSTPILSHQHTAEFYPSSTMKIFLAFHGIANWANYATGSINVWPNHTSDNHQGETPTPTLFSTVVNQMMINSNNQTSNAIIDRWGRASINNYLANQGLTNTEVINKLGTGPYSAGDKTYTTLTDLGRAYERIHQEAVFNTARRTFLYNNMLSHLNRTTFNTVINQEATSLGVSAANRNQFRSLFTWCAKAGSNTFPGSNPAFNGYVSIAGYASIPYRNSVPRQYVFGAYAVEAQTQNSVNIWTLATELLRKEIRAALQTWK